MTAVAFQLIYFSNPTYISLHPTALGSMQIPAKWAYLHFLLIFLQSQAIKVDLSKIFFHNLYKTNWGFVFSIVSRDVCTISILVSLPGFLFWRLIAIHMIRTVLYFAPVMLFGCCALVVAAPKLTKSVHWRFGAFFSLYVYASLSIALCVY